MRCRHQLVTPGTRLTIHWSGLTIQPIRQGDRLAYINLSDYSQIMTDDVTTIRAFNRTVTRRLGGPQREVSWP